MSEQFQQKAREMTKKLAITIRNTPHYPDHASYVAHIVSIIERELNLSSLVEDKERLDWLEKSATIVGEEIMGITISWADTLRREIDSARHSKTT